MGISVSFSLIIGVPLKDMCEIREDHQVVNLTDNMGNKTGRTFNLISSYAIFPSGKSMLIGSNKGNQRLMRYSLDDEDEYYEYFHVTSSNYGLDEIMVGIDIESLGLKTQFEEFQQGKMYEFSNIQAKHENAKRIFHEIFSYDGELHVCVVPYYSY